MAYSVKRKRSLGIQAGKGFVELKSVGSQCENSPASYNRAATSTSESTGGDLSYDELVQNYLCNPEYTLKWLKDENIISSTRKCSVCDMDMKWTKTHDRSDGYKWECRRKIKKKQHKNESSIREKSWFEKSNMTIPEVLKLTYWWCADLSAKQISKQLKLGSSTIVDWCSFCREVCEEVTLRNNDPIGGQGVRVQIDESKVGKRKYHRGHFVEGQWVFGGIEEDSRKSFMFAVEDRSENTLIPLIKKWIKPGSIIISDCWKSYCNLPTHGYTHLTVNHSLEFVNEQGYHTNKIEGHWRQMKVSLPTHGRRKYHYSSYLAEFQWRYTNADKDLFFQFLKDIKSIYNVN
jgi:transposase-like protein